MAATIYLHWTATGYDWIRPGHYHSIITGDGRVHRLHSYGVDLPAHTWGRNSNSVALACACMGGQPDPWSQPPSAWENSGADDEDSPPMPWPAFAWLNMPLELPACAGWAAARICGPAAGY